MTSADTTPLLQISGLKKYFPLTQGIVMRRTVGHVQAVDGVDLQINRGETVGLVGESGCGKSTVSKLLVGLEKPTAGTITYKGRDVARMNGKQLKQYRREVQIIFQDPYSSLNPRMTVGDIVAEGWSVHRGVAPRKDRTKRVQELLDRVGLNPNYINRYPHEFSGGQRQRVGIARALAMRPEVIVCDEPVSALDVSVQAQVVNLLEDLQDELGMAYLFIAHDLSVVRHISDRLAVMYLGRIVEEGGAEEVYLTPGHPYTQALLSSVPVHEPALRGKKERIILSGDVPSPANPPSGCRFRTRCFKAQELCAQKDPALELRGLSHPTACHFAEVHDVLHAEA
ncbi:oligopeptide/dipeptide ABC transporter, ATPase subunit [Xylanimonas cellulosilytica DSM 15894]|uniref:Oligopeptide/dipeptide ABC transporter, ATPase subunit n=1 Tax=Xylanimonas cellulosilytica (strain DSM 15894 / JCM 12276 / CECT 5975 / KCTC 9989 / LMG 20990 / NBRC 107835 / XIL07) TaxID=446471 RepID=D1BYR2_XYLCX|nr:dipeptide ABC transporter ATP-binding protein [Xylanimonas cellulosilytica]ACZ29987.1 oligopeptide/dipeptide ABC transporter, ATPase subunit [Xylanimonas cellulosilytica DSM 15894]